MDSEFSQDECHPARGPTSKNLQKTVQQNSEELALTVAMNGPLGDVFAVSELLMGTWLG